MRVVATSRLGTVGYHNDERALMQLSADRRRPKFICGRNVAGKQCGGKDGKGGACSACKRFGEEHPGLLDGARTPHIHHIVLDAAGHGGGGGGGGGSSGAAASVGGASGIGGASGGADASSSGGSSGGEACEDPHRLLLTHELEKAAPISGVHMEAWNGYAFKDGDVVSIVNGRVRHKRSSKEHRSYPYLPTSPHVFHSPHI